jgi:hypothetical protein
MPYMQCPDCKLTAPAAATYLRGDRCPRCMTTMEPRERFRPEAIRSVVETPGRLAAVPPA